MPEGCQLHDIAADARSTAIPIAADDHDALPETVAVLSDLQAMVAIDAYRAAPEDVVPWSVVEAELRRAGRLPGRHDLDLDQAAGPPPGT